MTTAAMILGWVCLALSVTGLCVAGYHAPKEGAPDSAAWRSRFAHLMSVGWAIAAALMWMAAR